MKTEYAVKAFTHFVCVFLLIRTFFYVAPCFLSNFVNNGLTILATLFIGWQTFKFTKDKWLNERIQPDGKAVLITGCDSGFGKSLAARLDSKGYHVFASCQFASGLGALDLKKKCSNRLQILELDVTKDQSVQDALKFVKDNLGTSELWALVNNAGVLKGFSVEITGMKDFIDCLEVNAYGPLRVTKAFLPLLRQSKGRIVNLTSLLGRMVMPHCTPYTMSKYAAVGFTDCLRQELDVWGVTVVSVEPEIFQTGLTDKTVVQRYFQTTVDELDESIKLDYGADHIKNLERIQRIFVNLASPKVELVVDDVESGVSSKYPEPAYSPRRNYLFRSLLYIFKISPIFLQDIFVKIAIFVFVFIFPNPAVN